MPKIFEYSLQIKLYHRLIVICVLQFHNTFSYLYSIFGKELFNNSTIFQSSQFRAKYILQNFTYPQKHSTYSCKVFKCNSNNKKSYQKEEKALLKHSKCLFFSKFSRLFNAVLHTPNTNSDNKILCL
jgi:hypothetical protein